MPAESKPPPSHAWLSDRPSWCVDLGATLQAMSTCEVWLALAKGELTPETKVWREGMPYWDKLDQVPEFSLALPEADAWGPVSATVAKRTAALEAAGPSPISAAPSPISAAPSPISAATKAISTLASRLEQDAREWPLEALLPEVPSAEELAAHAIAASQIAASARMSEPRVAGVATMAPPSDFVTPPPVVVDEPEAPRAIARSRRRVPQVDRRTALSVAFGAAVAVTALVMATTGPVPGRTSSPISLESKPFTAGAPERGVTFRPAQTPPNVIAPAQAREDADAPSALDARSAGVETSDGERARAPRGPRAADRGQQRVRGGTRR